MEELIKQRIKQIEDELDHTLTPENYDFLARHLADFVERSIRKYINGSIEHGDNFLQDVDHIKELGNEIIDLNFYLGGAIHKRNLHDNRLQQK